MRLFVSALLLCLSLAPVAIGQTAAPGSDSSQTLNSQSLDLQLESRALNDLFAHRVWTFPSDGCPLTLTSASVAPKAGYLPVAPRPGHDGALDLHFRNSSGKVIVSATVTASLRVKTDIYALDASPVDLRLQFAGTKELDRDLEQLRQIPLPDHAYLFGVAQVSLDQVVFADGSVWHAPAASACRTEGPTSLRIEAR